LCLTKLEQLKDRDIHFKVFLVESIVGCSHGRNQLLKTTLSGGQWYLLAGCYWVSQAVKFILEADLELAAER